MLYSLKLVRHEVYDESGKVVYSQMECPVRNINLSYVEKMWDATAGDRLYKCHLWDGR